MWHFRSVHFPIALLLVGALVEVVARVLRKDEWHSVSVTLLGFGLLGALGSVATGLWMESSHNHPHLHLHKNLGLSCLGVSGAALIFHLLRHRWTWAATLRTLCYLGAASLVALTGHYGGMMAHGQDDDRQKTQPEQDSNPGPVIRIVPKKIAPKPKPSQRSNGG